MAFIGPFKLHEGHGWYATKVAGNELPKASEKPVKIRCSQAELDAVS